jgi:hypothetical protein
MRRTCMLGRTERSPALYAVCVQAKGERWVKDGPSRETNRKRCPVFTAAATIRSACAKPVEQMRVVLPELGEQRQVDSVEQLQRIFEADRGRAGRRGVPPSMKMPVPAVEPTRPPPRSSHVSSDRGGDFASPHAMGPSLVRLS